MKEKRSADVSYNDYVVTFSNVEWDADDSCDDHNLEVVRKLPTKGTMAVSAPHEEAAKEWAMDDFSDNHGFCIQGCNITVNKID